MLEVKLNRGQPLPQDQHLQQNIEQTATLLINSKCTYNKNTWLLDGYVINTIFKP